MGCLGSKVEKESGDDNFTDITREQPKTVDPRLPFDNYRQLFNMKNSWKAVSRSMEKVAKDNLMLFFEKYPQHKALHKDLAKFDDNEKMKESNAFEMAAVGIFNTIDFVMENSEKLDGAMKNLKIAGKTHKRIPNFQASYFTDMEDTFIQAVRNHLGDRFTEPTEENFRKLYRFVVEQMTAALES